jgi:polyhydroxyalkanoate synthesis regulator phasin
MKRRELKEARPSEEIRAVSRERLAPETIERIAVEALDAADREIESFEVEAEIFQALPEQSETPDLAEEAGSEIGLRDAGRKITERLWAVTESFHADMAEAIRSREAGPWEPEAELARTKSQMEEVRELARAGEITFEEARRRERDLLELYKAEYIRQQEAIRELQERLIETASDRLITASGLTLRELDEVCRDPARARELMEAMGTDNMADLFNIVEDRSDPAGLWDILDQGVKRAGLGKEQIVAFGNGLRQMLDRHRAVGEAVSKYGRGRELAGKILGMRPEEVGEVEVLQGFGTLYIRFHNLESYTRFAAGKFDPEAKISEQERSFAAHSGGVSIPDAPPDLQKLRGALIAENAGSKPYEGGSHALKLHETQHALRRVYPEFQPVLSQAYRRGAAEDMKEKPDLLIIAEAVASIARDSRLKEIDPSAHDEILAYFAEDTDLQRIYEILTKEKLYDYYGRGMKSYVTFGSGFQSLPDQARVEIIERVFGDEYRGELYRGLRVIEKLQKLGMKSLEIRALLLPVPLTKWPTFLTRFTEQRYPQMRREMELGPALGRLDFVLEQVTLDLLSLDPASRPEANEFIEGVKKAREMLKEKDIEAAIELMEKVIGGKYGQKTSRTNTLRIVVQGLYDALDGRAGLPAYGFETEKMSPNRAAKEGPDAAMAHFTLGEIARLRKLILAGLWEEVMSPIEVSLAKEISLEKPGIQELRVMRSALRSLRALQTRAAEMTSKKIAK